MLTNDMEWYQQLNTPTFDVEGQTIENTYRPFLETKGEGDTVITVAELSFLDQIKGNKALVLTETESPVDLNLPLDQLDTIIVLFSNFIDGRGYSFSRLLRRKGFKGELRAAGDVFKDVIFYLKRSGFNSFALKPGKNIEDAKQGLHTFSSGYQADALTNTNHYQTGRTMHVRH